MSQAEGSLTLFTSLEYLNSPLLISSIGTVANLLRISRTPKDSNRTSATTVTPNAGGNGVPKWRKYSPRVIRVSSLAMGAKEGRNAYPGTIKTALGDESPEHGAVTHCLCKSLSSDPPQAALNIGRELAHRRVSRYIAAAGQSHTEVLIILRRALPAIVAARDGN